MDLQALRIFKAVADEGSVTRAAGRLHYVQSNVTARLRGLEEALGTELFHRTGRRLAITPAGRTLQCSRCLMLFASCDSSEDRST